MALDASQKLGSPQIAGGVGQPPGARCGLYLRSRRAAVVQGQATEAPDKTSAIGQMAFLAVTASVIALVGIKLPRLMGDLIARVPRTEVKSAELSRVVRAWLLLRSRLHRTRSRP
jgi:hypothetical protein